MLMTLGGCGAFGSSGENGIASASSDPVARENSPSADYPIVLGEPYSVEGKLFTPEDKLSFDAVGFAGLDQEGGNAITGSHRTLPLPSYVEVTSLESGRTILVRMERRGLMYGNAEVGLSRGAFAQLGSQPGAPVRVRRVLPPEFERAKLRAGERAAERMETPQSLVGVLRRKLPAEGYRAGRPRTSELAAVDAPIATTHSSNDHLPELPPAPVTNSVPVPMSSPQPATASVDDIPALPPLDNVAPARTSTPVVQKIATSRPSTSVRVAPGSGFVVQAAAFSSQSRADSAAAKVDGSVTKSGTFYRVRTGPFASRGEAESSLAKVRAAGYSDARIFRN